MISTTRNYRGKKKIEISCNIVKSFHDSCENQFFFLSILALFDTREKLRWLFGRPGVKFSSPNINSTGHKPHCPMCLSIKSIKVTKCTH